jgi:hypothetical protein
MFKVLRYFQQAHGHCDVPPNARRGSLASWLREQRADARAGRLLPRRFRRLEALGVALGGSHGSRTDGPARRDELWNARFAQLIRFKKRFGHCDVPCHWPKDRVLGNWVSNQRSFRNKGWLKQERIDQLDKVGFRWIARFDGEAPPGSFRPLVKVLDQRWEAMFAALVRYKRKHGHCNVRPRDGRSLSRWANRCRSEAKRGALRADRRGRLDQLGFQWEVGGYHLQAGWEARFAQLVAYKNRFGHCDVPCHWPKDRSFGNWVSNQRSFRNKGWLSQERIDRLDRLGFRWIARLNRQAPPMSFRAHLRALDQLWDARFAALVRYKRKHGHCNVLPGDGLGGGLNRWAIRCRSEAKRGALRADRRRRLDQLGFHWEGGGYHRQAGWEARLAQLLAYKKRFGDCDVPCHWPKDRVLGHWVSSQRSFRKKGLLSQERIDRLEKIGFRWDASRRRD